MPSSDTNLFDPRLELMAIQDYLSTRWDNLPADFWTVLSFLGNVAARDGLRFIDNHCVFEAVEPLVEQRKALIADKLPFDGADYYDQPLRVLDRLQSLNRGFREALLNQGEQWDWDKRVKTLKTEALSFCPELAQARPSGWDALRQGYNDFDGQEDYCKTQWAADMAAFQGTLRQSVLGGHFVQRTALPYVMYGAVCQGQDPTTALVDAVFAHILLAREAFNNEALAAAVLALPLKTDVPDLVLDLDLVLDASSNPHLRGLFAYAQATGVSLFIPQAQAREQLDQTMAQSAEYAALSEEEKAAIDQLREREFDALLASLAARPLEDKRDEQAAKFRELLCEQAPELVAPTRHLAT